MLIRALMSLKSPYFSFRRCCIPKTKNPEVLASGSNDRKFNLLHIKTLRPGNHCGCCVIGSAVMAGVWG